jgi:hypothetical protein
VLISLTKRRVTEFTSSTLPISDLDSIIARFDPLEDQEPNTETIIRVGKTGNTQ